VDLTLPLKDTVSQTGLKMKIQQSVVHRRPISDRNKHWLRVLGKKIYQPNGPPKQSGVAILISDKVDFKLTVDK
jgi:hypothetical protein